jgi:cell division protein FtsQ
MEVLGSDIGRNIFFVPLDERREQLEQIPWVESAAVMRFVPNRLKVMVQERTPVAFVRIGSHIGLIDNTGHIMEIPAHNKTGYSFPVIAGTRDTEPLSTRAARMKVYNELVRELDSEGGHYSSELSEVDLTDPEDTKVLVNDPSGDVLLHLGSVGSGSGNYLDRVKLYHAHVAEWRQQFEKLDSVDLRYERQVVVNPDLRSPAQASALSPAAAKAAVTAGVPAVALAAAALVKRQQAEVKPPLVAAKTTTKIPPKPANTKASTAKASAPKVPVAHAVPQVAKPALKVHEPVKVHEAVKKASRKAKKAVHKRGKATKRSKKPPASVSAAKTVKHASTKTTAPALVPAKPHQAMGTTKSSSNGKPHAAIVN